MWIRESLFLQKGLNMKQLPWPLWDIPFQQVDSGFELRCQVSLGIGMGSWIIHKNGNLNMHFLDAVSWVVAWTWKLLKNRICAIYKYHLRVYHIGEGHLTRILLLNNRLWGVRSAVPFTSQGMKSSEVKTTGVVQLCPHLSTWTPECTCRLDHVTEIGTCRLGARN